MVGSFFKTLMVTHFTPHGWGKMGLVYYALSASVLEVIELSIDKV